MRLVLIVSGIIMVSLLGVAFGWSRHWVLRPLVMIEAAHDVPEHGLPVYAQFVVTQRLFLPEISSVTGLRVPVYWPAQSERLQIELRRNGNLIQRWQLNPAAQNQVVTADLSLLPPQLIDGNLEVSFSNEQLTHEGKDQAPRIFVETADSNYAAGNYQIAQNEKRGDVEMQLTERVRRWHIIKEEFGVKPLAVLFQGGKWLLLLLFLINLPILFWASRVGSLAHVDRQVKQEY